MNNTSKIRIVLSGMVSMLLLGCSETLHEPLPNAAHRATPLHFGLHVTADPSDNPIDPPERFSGYHAALDFEISEGEVDGDVPVFALCAGKIVYSGFAGGYGGLIIQRCTINKQAVTVLYGHLKISSLAPDGMRLKPGQSIALLGANKSHDTDQNRKHLHLGIHKGKSLDLRGYVQTEEELSGYIDPATVLAEMFLDLPGETPGETPFWEHDSESEE